MKKAIVGSVVTFSFKDGVEPVVFDTAVMNESNKARAVPFGMGHRLGDMAATATSEQARRDAVAAGATHYAKPDATWNMRGDSAPTLNPHVQALAAKLGKSYAEAMVFIAQKALDELA